MSVFSYSPQQGFTPQDIDAWLLAAKEKHAALHLQAAAPWNSNEHHAIVMCACAENHPT
jgi:hypothetical protein